MYKQGLFHDWVPKPLQLILIIVCILPFLVVSGIYSNNINDMASGLGAMSEVFVLSNYAGFIGMATVMPLLMRTKQYFRSKEMAVGTLLIISLLSWVCMTTDNANLIVFSSFFIGGLKMLGMIEFILPVYFIIAPSMDRTKFYPVFYPFSIILAQFAGYCFSQMAYAFNWQHVYLFVIIYMLTCALLLTVFMHNSLASKKVPFYQFSWFSLVWFAVLMMVLNYVLVYTKFHGWFQSPVIRWGIGVFVVMLFFFVLGQRLLKRPFISMAAFSYKNVYSSFIMILLMSIYLGSSSAQSTYMMGILKYSSQTSGLVNLAMIPGVILGGVICYYWFKHIPKIKGLVSIGFGSYLLAQVIIYFLFAPELPIEYFFLPTMLKGVGLCVLYISIASYCSDNVKMSEQLSVFSILILFRSFVGPALFGSVFSWLMYKLQLQNASDLAAHMDATNTIALMRGGGMGLYGPVQMQSIMLAAKQLFGITIVAGIVVMIYVALHRFEPIHHRRLIHISKWSKGESTKGYRLYSAQEEEEAIDEAVITVV